MQPGLKGKVTGFRKAGGLGREDRGKGLSVGKARLVAKKARVRESELGEKVRCACVGRR